MTFIRPTLSELIARDEADFSARLDGADSRLRRSVLSVLARVHAGTADGLYGALSFYARQLMPDTAEAEYLDRWSTIWGVQRKAASSASGTVQLSGVKGAIVPAGTEMARIDGARFVTKAAAVLGDDGTTVEVEAVVSGAAGVTAVAAQLTCTSPVAGVAAIGIATDGLGGGADEESDPALLARLLNRIQVPPAGGTQRDFVAWALEVPGVTRAWAFSGWMGAGSVGVTFVCDGRADIIPLQDDLDAVEAHLEPLRPVIAKPVVFAPTPLYVDVLLSITPDNPTGRAAVQAELQDLFMREAAPGGTIYISRVREAVSLSAGEYDNQVFSPAANFVAPAGFFPMLGEVRFQ